jgi:hypothetical protein
MPATQERVNGAIDSFYDEDTGAVSQETLPTKFDFYHPGANIEFSKGENVNYLKVTTPNGRVIVNDIKTGHM